MVNSKSSRILFLTGIMMLLTIVAAPQLFAWVHQGDLILTKQSDIDVIKKDLTEVTGTITITGADITNLNQLFKLEKIGGDLIIKDTPNLKNLDGLSSLKKVDKKVNVDVEVPAPHFIPKRVRTMQQQQSIR